ncbi:hypothetical protein Tco_0958114 [Tanacetum coccineum]
MSSIITCVAALNPSFNVHGVELLSESILTDFECFDDGFATKAKELFNQSFQGLYNTYYLKYGDTTTQSESGSSSSRSHSDNLMTNLLNRLKDHSNKWAKNDRLTSSEYERYLSSDFISHLRPDEFAGFDVLGYWKAKESMFLIISRMADATDRKQHTSNLENCLDFEEEILEEEVQDNEAIALSDEEIALDEAASDARSNGSCSGGEDVDLTLSESD